MASQKVVIPAACAQKPKRRSKAGIHGLCNKLKFLDSRFHGNDEKMQLETFCERIKSEAASLLEAASPLQIAHIQKGRQNLPAFLCFRSVRGFLSQ